MQPRRASWRRGQLAFCLGGGHRTWVSLTSKWGFTTCTLTVHIFTSQHHITVHFLLATPSSPPSCPSWAQTLVTLNSALPGAHKDMIDPSIKGHSWGPRPQKLGALCTLTITPDLRVAITLKSPVPSDTPNFLIVVSVWTQGIHQGGLFLTLLHLPEDGGIPGQPSSLCPGPASTAVLL